MLETTLDIRPLIDKALLERGEAILVLAHPMAGEGAVIDSANAEFERLVGRPGQLAGVRLGSLRTLAEVPSEWSVFITSLRRLAPLQLDLRLLVDGRRRWLQFRLVFDTDDEERVAGAMLIGRDVSRARRRESEEAETQRVLADVFQHAAAALAVVRDDGAVLMANEAFQRLLGFAADDMIAVNMGRLAAPEHQVAAAAARAKQSQDGVAYEMRLDVLTRAGSRLPVCLASVMLPDHGEPQLRVVSLVAEAARAGKRPAAASLGSGAPPDRYGMPGIAVGQVLVLSLQAIKAASSGGWARVGPRAMMLAEQIIRRRLGGSDVFSRSDDDGFVIWFGSQETERNEAALANIVREVRLRFLLELGGELAVDADTVTVAKPAAPAEAAEVAADPLNLLMDDRCRRNAAAVSLLQDLRAARRGETSAVTDRDGRATPWLVVDFAPALRRRLALAGGSLPCEGGSQEEIELLRCGLALAELVERPGSDKVLVQLGWSIMAQPDSRRALDDRLARAGAGLRARLVVLVAGMPPLLSAKRWTEVVSGLRTQLADVAPVLSVSSGAQASPQETIAGDWPLTLTVVDGAAPDSGPVDGYVGLITAARRRGVAVLARPAAASDIRDWRELGATMFMMGH